LLGDPQIYISMKKTYGLQTMKIGTNEFKCIYNWYFLTLVILIVHLQTIFPRIYTLLLSHHIWQVINSYISNFQ